jgi:ferritin-like metal-binding protein YciE
MSGTDSDPLHHTRKQTERLHETVQHLRKDVAKVQDPRAQGLLETAAEVLGGLEKAFRDYETGTELAWKR